MTNKLVIVESPAKARTLGKILGKGYTLKASLGHVRDLPRSRLGVDVEHDFTPKYVVPKDKRKVVQELKEAIKSASTVYLATDPDREGEAISWHLAEVTRTNDVPYQRVTFHEITKEAVLHAFKHPRSIDIQLVNAQQARRILDRLVGYKISPLLWNKVRKRLSAGRVQSVALRIIVDREREIQQFVKEEYWSVDAELKKHTGAEGNSIFKATLIGHLNGTRLHIHTQTEADKICQGLKEASYQVAKVGSKKATRQPPPPFITSTLQQEAWRKLRFTAKQTMAIAQQLYEGLPVGSEGTVGLITYMRTDSTRVANHAVTETREFISDKYGPQFLPPHARSFSRKVKGAQEAHEAIRPTSTRREPSIIKQHLTSNQFKLYQLIWQRMIASQMSAATFNNITVDIKASLSHPTSNYLLRASSSDLIFAGFTVLYKEGKDETDKTANKSSPLPHLEKEDALVLVKLNPEQHFTQPPPRFTEATLVKSLEQEGIGRPSTYAPILSTIQEREYVTRSAGTFHTTELGIIVNDILAQYFSDVIDIGFTARMEQELDEIVSEHRDWTSVIRDFYTPFEINLTQASSLLEKVEMADELVDETCPKCNRQLAIKTGRYGKFLACSGYPECKYSKSYQIKTGVKCPECGSELVEKLNKKRRTFFGCSNYPDCQFATNFRPLPEPCPKCGSMQTLYRSKWAKCTKCAHKSKVETTET